MSYILLRSLLRPCRCSHRHHFSTAPSPSPSRPSSAKEQLRIAVVGGGAAGMSSALHLAPLVESGHVSMIDIFDASARPKREIGVGIWSTALDPFQQSQRTSHQLVYDEMNKCGSWLGDVGYRTPSGKWLMKSHLPTKDEDRNMPALLFLREQDFLYSLQRAVHWECQQGTIQFQSGFQYKVTGLEEDSSLPWSCRLRFENGFSERDYHLIISAEGTYSSLRHTYGGHESIRSMLSTGSLPSQNELPRTETVSAWDAERHKEAVELQDRKYTVFRGNSLLKASDFDSLDIGISFQTWGEGRSMRFATVPMHYPGPMGSTEERQVWFITIDDDAIVSEEDPVRRRAMLLEAFSDWHDPIQQIVEATPADQILMERAIAHRHSMGPVLDFNHVIQKLRGTRPPNSGKGPCLIFTGDAFMTVDPILAQGFTFALEAAHATSQVVGECFQPYKDLSFDPFLLRELLHVRHDRRLGRLICLLRATELVQALGQPSGGTLTGKLNTKLLRPLTRLMPNFIKKPIFDSVLKYSLGVYANHQRK